MFYFLQSEKENLEKYIEPAATEQIDFEQQFKTTNIPFKKIIAADADFKKMLFDEFLVSDAYSLNINFTKTVHLLHNIQEQIDSLQDFFLNEANVNLSIDTYNEEAKVIFTNLVYQLEKFGSIKLRVKIVESILENNISITAITDVYLKEFDKKESKADVMFMSLKKRLNSFLSEYLQKSINDEEKSADRWKKVNSPPTFKTLFKDGEHEKLIIEKVKEYLSESGDWITEPKGRYLVALFSVLLEKGYLKNTFSAPQISGAFNNKFGTNLSGKIFQPSELLDASNYKEHFKLIPAITTA